MNYFVPPHNIVRKIWGKSDTILFIFAGAAAEFALNKAVDWLYFTGKLPSNPIGRLFSTVQYARAIVFAPEEEALKTIDKITTIHKGVESARGAEIPDWAYRDVLFMLIHYSIASFELLERSLTDSEKSDVYAVFYRMGTRMQLAGLPPTYTEWLPLREQHLQQNLEASRFTHDLFLQYKKHLGPMRFAVLKQSQIMVVPQRVRQLLSLRSYSLLKPIVPIYKISRSVGMDWLIKEVLLPHQYKAQIKSLDVAPT